MIIVKLVGGLGNQMFQYALAKHLTLINDTDLKLDIYAFGDYYNLHNYSLTRFNFSEDFASRNEVENIKRAYSRVKFWRNNKIIKEKKVFTFDKDVIETHGNLYIDGYWQSYKYFEKISHIIKDEFQVTTDPEGKNKELLDKITSSQAVCLHIRRGDYVSNKKTNSIFGTCTLDYYYKALDLINNKVSNAEFFIFSDDPEWCQEHLQIANPTTYINHNGVDKNYEDIRLMYSCKHFIIANSTFSWWGAWLSQHEKKIVIAPSQWFNKKEIGTPDLLPTDWIKMG